MRQRSPGEPTRGGIISTGAPRGVVPLLLAAVALGAALWFGRRPAQPVPVAAVSVTAVDEGAAPAVGATITVHVAGAVVDPGLVEVAVEARVADVVVAAGGALPEAALDGLNLAAPVHDGEQVVVPHRGGPSAAAGGSSGDDGRVRVNVAGASELEALPGVGPVLAARIVEYRDANGPFATIEDLLDVPGIGEGTLAAMRDAVLVP